MISLDHEIEIEAPIEYVLEWVSNSESWRRSNPAGLDVEVIDDADALFGERWRSSSMGGPTTAMAHPYELVAFSRGDDVKRN